MDVFNKLRNTVSSTVSQLSCVLPGNPVTREFEVTTHAGSYGPGLLWKIYTGYKKSTKQEAAIFVFEKKILEKYPKHDRDVILNILRKGISQLTRLRHPKILTVQHPLEESRESLAFATEPVFASLANVLGQYENAPSPLPSELKEYKLFEVEIKYGILQLAESLAFLHNDVKMLHRNLAPESILISKSGSWKIAGFEFCIVNRNPPDEQSLWQFHEWDIASHHHAQPNLDYLAPEYALSLSCDTASDMYSLGALISTVYNNNRPLFSNNGDFTNFKKNACELKSMPPMMLDGIPNGLREYIKMLLNVTPEIRPDAHQFSKISFFDDVGAKTLQYLDSLYQWDNLQKSHFYKGLPQIITKMPKRVNIDRILPCLMKEFPNVDMIPFVLPNVLLIAEDATKEEFRRLILPGLKPVFKIQEPVQILLVFLQKMELLLTKTPAQDIKDNILPMLFGALESNVQQIQELCLSIIPNFATLVEYSSMKNAMLPRIKHLCLTTAYLSVRVNCLICIGKLLEHLDKWLVLDDVLPLLSEIPSKEPAVLMGILGIYKLTMSNKKLGITKEIMATKVIPFLVPLCIENGLSLNQFNACVTLVKEMLNQVENEHRIKLEQLNSIQQEQKSALEMSKVQGAKKEELITGFTSKPISEMDTMFEGFGLGSFIQEKDVSKVAESLTSPKDSYMTTMNSHSNKSLLTLEEKQRLVRAQDQQNIICHQKPIKPLSSSTPTVSRHSQASPRDLTDSLINSNLMNISGIRQQQPAYIPGMPGKPIPSTNFPLDFPTNYSPISNFNCSTQPKPMASMSSSWLSTQPLGTPSYGPMKVAQRPNMSPLDDLLPKSPLGDSKASLNELAHMKNVTSNSFVKSSTSTFVQSPTNTLSQSDISDLLG